jgi:hypothetical protein
LEWLARAQFQEHPAEMANRAQRYGTKRTASHLVGRDYKLTFGLVGRIIN